MKQRTKRRLFRSVSIVAGIATLWFLAILPGFRNVYQKERDYSYGSYISKSERQTIKEETAGMNEDGIRRYALSFIDRKCRYSYPKQDYATGRVNCTGYAKIYADVYNTAMRSAGLGYKARPVAGDVKWYGISVCKLLVTIVPTRLTGWVGDHDFVMIFNPKGEKHIQLDPCFHDLIGSDLHHKQD